MAGWQGLYDDVIGTTYAPLGTPIPISRKLFRELQKRGNYAVSQNLKDNGGTVMVVPATRDNVQYTDGDLGGKRVIESNNIVGTLTDPQLHTIFDTKISLNMVADSSGNGGGAFS